LASTGFKASQIAAMNTDQKMAIHLASPIVLDLNGDGVSTQSIAAGVQFDLLAQGQAVNTGWVSATDGLLARDLNGDGVINSGAELFGSATTLANGQTAPDGYSALNELDSNHDGVINSQDAAFKDLRVWVDANADGVTEQGELKTLAQLNISQLSLATDSNASMNNGNVVGLNSSYQTTDGASHAAADVWFQVDLRAQVTNLTQAMSQFNAAPDASVTAAVSLTESAEKVVTTSSSSLPAVSSEVVARLVDALRGASNPSPVVSAPSDLAEKIKPLPIPGLWLSDR
jgi:hypothetical protein